MPGLRTVSADRDTAPLTADPSRAAVTRDAFAPSDAPMRTIRVTSFDATCLATAVSSSAGSPPPKSQSTTRYPAAASRLANGTQEQRSSSLCSERITTRGPVPRTASVRVPPPGSATCSTCRGETGKQLSTDCACTADGAVGRVRAVLDGTAPVRAVEQPAATRKL